MIAGRLSIQLKHFEAIKDHDVKLARAFDNTVVFKNLMGTSYTGSAVAWVSLCFQMLKKNPMYLIVRLRMVAWSFKNLIRSKNQANQVRS